MVASDNLDLHGGLDVDQYRAVKGDARSEEEGRVVVSIEVDETDLREIALAGYPDAVSTDRAIQGKAVSLFLSDAING